MRRTPITVCPKRCGAEENLLCPEHSEGNGVVLKIAANRSRQLGEVCASIFVNYFSFSYSSA